MTDIVSVIRTEVAFLDVGTGEPPIFIHGPKSFQNLKADKTSLLNGIVFLDTPVTSNDTPETTGAYTEVFPLVIFFGFKVTATEEWNMEVQRTAIMQARLLRFQLVNRLKQRTDLTGIDSIKTVEVMNVYDKNISGVVLYVNVKATSGDAVCETEKNQATATLDFVDITNEGDAFTIHFPEVGIIAAHDVVFDFRPVVSTPENIEIGGTLAQQGQLFANAVSAYLQANEQGLSLPLNPNPQTKEIFSCIAGLSFDGEIGNGIILSWTNPRIFSQVSPLHLSGGTN